MGRIYNCECDLCGFSFDGHIGVGFSYEEVYVRNLLKMKAGKYGIQGKEFLEKHPDGTISCEMIVVQCNKCGQLSEEYELSMYVSKCGYKSPEPAIDTYSNHQNHRKIKSQIPYVTPEELKMHYTEFVNYSVPKGTKLVTAES